MEQRLMNLAERVTLKRSEGFVSFWPEDIKREALFLVDIFGTGKVSKITKLSIPSLVEWKKKFPVAKQESSNDKDAPPIIVTRMIAHPVEVSKKEPHVVASMIKNNIEFKIFCKEVAVQIAERISQ